MALKDWIVDPAHAATVTVATPATDTPDKRSSVATVASVTVADSQNTTHGIIWRIAERHKLGLSDLESAAGKDWPEVLASPDLAEALAGAVTTRRMRERGERPAHYTQRATCAACGPVWLWEGAPLNVVGCPWCFNRAAGRPVPHPAQMIDHAN